MEPLSTIYVPHMKREVNLEELLGALRAVSVRAASSSKGAKRYKCPMPNCYGQYSSTTSRSHHWQDTHMPGSIHLRPEQFAAVVYELRLVSPARLPEGWKSVLYEPIHVDQIGSVHEMLGTVMTVALQTAVEVQAVRKDVGELRQTMDDEFLETRRQFAHLNKELAEIKRGFVGNALKEVTGL